MTSWNIVLRNDINQLECAKATLLFCTNLHYNYEQEADWRTDYPVKLIRCTGKSALVGGWASLCSLCYVMPCALFC